MASTSKRMKPSSSTENLQREVKVLEPIFYECVNSITEFGQKFPNVLIDPDMTTEQRFESLPAIQHVTGYSRHGLTAYENQATALPKGNAIVPEFKVTLLARHYLAAADQVEYEDDRIRICFLVGHALSGQQKKDLTDISVSVVTANGGTLHTPELRFNNSVHSFGRRVTDLGLTTFVTWDQSLKNVWNGNEGESYFPDGTLRLKVQVGRDYSQTYLGLPKSLKTMADTWLDLLNTGDLSDFTITSGTNNTETFNVHQFILRNRSEHFKNMFSHKDCAEVKEGKMSIPDVEPDTLRNLLEFIYGAKVEPENLDVQQLGDLIAAADKYQISELKDICFNYLIKDMNDGNVRELAILAVDHHASREIWKRVSDFIAKNFESLRELPEFDQVLVKCKDLLCTY